jgi:hypothetical protein
MRIQSLVQLKNLLQVPNDIVVDHSETHMAIMIEIARRIHDNLCETLKYEFKIDYDGQDRSDFAQIEIPPSML